MAEKTLDKEPIIDKDDKDIPDKIDYTVDNCTFDCELICKDGIKLYYSSHVLAKYFKVFKQSFTKKDDKRLVFEDFDSNIVIEVLRWLDTDDIYLITSTDIGEKMYMFGSRYDCHLLMDQIEEYLIEFGKLSTLIILHDYKSKKYKVAVKAFINSNEKSKDAELDYVPRYILDDIVSEHKINSSNTKILDTLKEFKEKVNDTSKVFSGYDRIKTSLALKHINEIIELC